MIDKQDTIQKLNLVHNIITSLVNNGTIHVGFICFQLNESPDGKNDVASSRYGSKDCDCFNELCLQFLQRMNVIHEIDLIHEESIFPIKES